MRRTALVFLFALWVSGCGGGRRADAGLAARAGSAELTAERLAHVLAASRDVPLRTDIADAIARRWVEFALLGERTAAGDRLADSATMMAVAWPDVRGAVVDSFRTVRLAGRVQVTASQVDSAFGSPDVRYLKQILKRTPQGMPSAVRDSLRRVITAIRDRLEAGGSWAEANAQNDDPRSRAAEGALGLVTRGQTVPAFERPAFALAPGQFSDIVVTPFGFHVIYRPRLEEVREAFAADLRDLLAQPLDSAYQAGLLAGRHVAMTPGAAGGVRYAVLAPGGAQGSDVVLARYDGGRFTVGDLDRYLGFFPPGFQQQVQAAPDAQLVDLVRSFVLRELAWRQADSARIVLPAEKFRQIAAAYREQMDRILAVTGLDPDSLSRAATTHGGRRREATRRIDHFFDAALDDPRLAAPLPEGLAQHLLEGGDWSVFPAGIEKAVLEAAMLRTAALDSAGAASRVPQPPGR